MKKLLASLVFIFNINSIYAQEIDSSIVTDLSFSEIELIKSQINEGEVNQKIEAPKEIEESIQQAGFDLQVDYGDKYGYSYFNTIPTSIMATGDLPLPNEYKISLNDQFTIILSGSKEAIFDLSVKLDGTILFPELGSVYVVGETFAEVKSKLKNLISQSYIGTEIDISLKNLSAKKITIVGAVNNPGSYLVNPFSTISSSLAYSGGVSPVGTLRDIRLIRTNGDTYSFDLYDLLINGDRSRDLTIQAGDVILIPPAKKFVQISGEVKRSATYEVKKDESIKDLVEYALGFNFPNLNKILVSKINQDTNIIELKNTNNLELSLKNILSVTIFGFNNRSISSAFIEGPVKEPGYYDIQEGESLSSLISRLEFIDVYPWLAVIEQFDKDNLINSSKLFSLKDENTYKNIKVLPGAKIHFTNISDRDFPNINSISSTLVNDYSLQISHKGNLYNLPIYGFYILSDLIGFLGLDMSDVDKKATYISPLEGIALNERYESMQFNAKKYNRIIFRSPVNDLITVTIEGAIDYPGIYTLANDATINDLYKLVGNFKNEAYVNGIIFTRESVRERQLDAISRSRDALNEAILVSSQKGENIGDISVIRSLTSDIDPKNLGRIAGDFSPGSISSINTVLYNGDTIRIPKNPNVINVLGEVLNPISFEYRKGISINEAINQAGGYREFAKKSGVYVIKANGITEKAKRNIFVKNINLEAGDTIIVPRNIITNNPGIDFLIPITQILSDLAFSAAALETLSDSN